MLLSFMANPRIGIAVNGGGMPNAAEAKQLQLFHEWC
jgi:hypothetical protein